MRITITLPEETNEWLRKQSYVFRMSKSKIINWILEEKIESNQIVFTNFKKED